MADPRPPARLGRFGTALGTAVLLTVTGCSSGTPAGGSDEGRNEDGRSSAADGSSDRPSGPSSPFSATRQIARYVALGDSYTAAPFVPTTDLAGGCLRSDGNYPALLAEDLDVARVVDVSCAGATTAEITTGQSVGGGRGRVPAQLAAVTGSTDLVTVGIGGNDEGLFERFARACIGDGGRPLKQCRSGVAASPAEVSSLIGRTRDRVARGLRRASAAAAGDAVVALVGYPRLVDRSRSCPALPLTVGDRASVARLERLLAAALRGAARLAGVRFVDMYAASRGHEICADDPWVNGAFTDPTRALAFHPFAVEQQQVASRVLDLLDRRSGR